MFEKLKRFFNLKLYTKKQIHQFAEKGVITQEQYTAITGEAGNGLVKVTMTGGGEVTNVTIDPKVVDPEDVDGLQDLILGAFGDATHKVQALAEEKMGPLSQGFGALGDGPSGLGF